MHEGSSCSSSRTGAAPQCPSEQHKERVSPLASPRQPKPPLPFPFPPPGVGRAAGQGGGGVGCTVRVGARSPPADEVCGAEPLHPLGQVRGGGEPRPTTRPHAQLLGSGAAFMRWDAR